MPDRIIRERTCTSDSLGAVSDAAERLFFRLTTKADDYGRFDSRPAVILGSCFPLVPSWTVETVAAALDELEVQDIVCRYEAEGRPCLHLPGWSEHQRTRESKPKFPEPVCGHSAADGGELPRVAASRGSRVVHVPEEVVLDLGSKKPGRLALEDFDAFWSVYPRRDDKGKARTALAGALKRAPLAEIIAGAERYRDDPNREAAFTKLPATWLHAEGWANGPLPARGSTNGHSAQVGKAVGGALDRARRLQEQAR